MTFLKILLKIAISALWPIGNLFVQCHNWPCQLPLLIRMVVTKEQSALGFQDWKKAGFFADSRCFPIRIYSSWKGLKKYVKKLEGNDAKYGEKTPGFILAFVNHNFVGFAYKMRPAFSYNIPVLQIWPTLNSFCSPSQRFPGTILDDRCR